MIDSRVFDAVESTTKAVMLGSVGSRKKLDAALLADDDVANLLHCVGDSFEAAEQLANRLRLLTELSGSPEFLHPHDVAIAVYLRVLDLSRTQLAESVAPAIASAPNIWWARPLAIQLLESSRTRSAAETVDDRLRFVGFSSDQPSLVAASSVAIGYPDFTGPVHWVSWTAEGHTADQTGLLAVRWPLEPGGQQEAPLLAFTGHTSDLSEITAAEAA